QYLYELMPVYGVAAELRVDVTPRMPHGTQRMGGHAREFAAFLHDQKRAQDQRRIAFETIFAAYGQAPADHAEICVDDLVLIERQWKEAFLDGLQQNGVQLTDNAGRPVIALHEQLAWPAGLGGFESIHIGQRRLQVEQEAVLTAPRQQVQLDAQPLEGLFGTTQRTQFGRRKAIVAGDFCPGHAHA